MAINYCNSLVDLCLATKKTFGSNWCLELFLRPALVNYYSSIACSLHDVATCKGHANCKGAFNKNLELSTHASLILQLWGLNHLNPNDSVCNFNL
jgi:hypothetical protein